MKHLKSLQAVTVLSFLANDVEHGINQLGSLGVMTLHPIISGTELPEDEVIGPEYLAVGPRSDGVHGTGLEVHEDGAWDVTAAAGLIVVDVHALQMELRIAVVPPGVIDAMLIANHLPEFGANLVAALPALDVQYLSHVS